MSSFLFAGVWNISQPERESFKFDVYVYVCV